MVLTQTQNKYSFIAYNLWLKKLDMCGNFEVHDGYFDNYVSWKEINYDSHTPDFNFAHIIILTDSLTSTGLLSDWLVSLLDD